MLNRMLSVKEESNVKTLIQILVRVKPTLTEEEQKVVIWTVYHCQRDLEEHEKRKHEAMLKRQNRRRCRYDF